MHRNAQALCLASLLACASACNGRFQLQRSSQGGALLLDTRSGRVWEAVNGAMVPLATPAESALASARDWPPQTPPGIPEAHAVLVTRWSHGLLRGRIDLLPQEDGGAFQQVIHLPDTISVALLDSTGLMVTQVDLGASAWTAEMGAHGVNAIHARFQVASRYDDYSAARSWRLRTR